MNRVVYYGSAVLAALVLGSVLTWWTVGRGMKGGVECGAWRHYPGYGSGAVGPYVRAQVQLAGPLPVNRSEAIYFIADRDDHGEPLRQQCDYRIEGHPLAARWWSVTAYGDDHHLISNGQNRYSWTSANIASQADGTWTVHLSRTEKGGNWIPMGEGNRVYLLLRMYNPDPAAVADVSRVDVPRILREDPTHE